MDSLFLGVYAAICAVIVYWRIIKPWNTTRHIRFLDAPVPSKIDVPHKDVRVHAHSVDLLDSEKVTLDVHRSGTQMLDHEFGRGIGWNPRPDNPDFMTAPASFLQQRLAEIQSFCSTPRAKAEIEGRFPGVDVLSLRNLGVLSEVDNFDRFGEYVWSGSKPGFVKPQEHSSDTATQRIKDPISEKFERLMRQARGDVDLKGGKKVLPSE